MSEKQWKLNEDMHPKDRILDPVTFEDIITMVHHNARIIDANAIKEAAKEILESRLQDFEYLIQNNINEIIAEAKKGRN